MDRAQAVLIATERGWISAGSQRLSYDRER
jgi:hypothetical protein